MNVSLATSLLSISLFYAVVCVCTLRTRDWRLRNYISVRMLVSSMLCYVAGYFDRTDYSPLLKLKNKYMITWMKPSTYINLCPLLSDIINFIYAFHINDSSFFSLVLRTMI